jgi:hypothetical protein
LRQLRGNCGGPFKRGLPHLDEDEQGLFIPAYRVAPDSDDAFSELKIRSCPVALANLATPIVNAFFSHVNGLFDIKTSYPSPSCAIVEAVDLLYYHHQLLKNRLHERQMSELNNGRK